MIFGSEIDAVACSSNVAHTGLAGVLWKRKRIVVVRDRSSVRVLMVYKRNPRDWQAPHGVPAGMLPPRSQPPTKPLAQHSPRVEEKLGVDEEKREGADSVSTLFY